MKKKVLFLCTGNSCRSQMAEGWARSILDASVDAFSAGTKPQPLNQIAVRVMRELGVDISSHTSKHLDTLKDSHFDLVVTVCDNAALTCPVPPDGTRVIHAPFDDPPHLAINTKSEEDALSHYRRVRDEIREFVKTLPNILGEVSKDKAQ
jgi:arsenate reductase